MDHIDMNPDQPATINWPELLLILAIILVLYGIFGNSDYTREVEQERDGMRAKLVSMSGELALAKARCGEPCGNPWAQDTLVLEGQ